MPAMSDDDGCDSADDLPPQAYVDHQFDKWLKPLIVCLCLFCYAPAHAMPMWLEQSPKGCSSLPAAPGSVAPLAAEWDGFRISSAIDCLAWQKYASMMPLQQQRIQSRLQEWARLTPEQRKLARQNFRQLNELPQDERQAVKSKIQQQAQGGGSPVAPVLVVPPLVAASRLAAAPQSVSRNNECSADVAARPLSGV